MTPKAFIAKWQHNTLKERASYQMHFLDLCELVGSDKPSPPVAMIIALSAVRRAQGRGMVGRMCGSAVASPSSIKPQAKIFPKILDHYR